MEGGKKNKGKATDLESGYRKIYFKFQLSFMFYHNAKPEDSKISIKMFLNI